MMRYSGLKIVLGLIMLWGGAAAAQSYPPDQVSGAPTPRESLMEKFAAANTSHDGRLTLAQAEAANLRAVVRHFEDIDVARKGYVTIDDLKAWRQRERALRAAQSEGGAAPAGQEP